MKKRTIAHISANGSVQWFYDWTQLDIDTMVRVQMIAEQIAYYQSTKEALEHE